VTSKAMPIPTLAAFAASPSPEKPTEFVQARLRSKTPGLSEPSVPLRSSARIAARKRTPQPMEPSVGKSVDADHQGGKQMPGTPVARRPILGDRNRLSDRYSPSPRAGSTYRPSLDERLASPLAFSRRDTPSRAETAKRPRYDENYERQSSWVDHHPMTRRPKLADRLRSPSPERRLTRRR
jgi:hypothetical protein